MEKELKESKELKEMLVKHGVVLAYLFDSHLENGHLRATPMGEMNIYKLGMLFEKDMRRFQRELHINALRNEINHLFQNDFEVIDLKDAAPILMYQIANKYGQLLFEDSLTHPQVEFKAYTASRCADWNAFLEAHKEISGARPTQ